MSFSWRKRQALASDQQSCRALGTDSALWKRIERNHQNSKTVAATALPKGIEGVVTGVKFQRAINNVGSNMWSLTDPSSGTIRVSDASDATITPIWGNTMFDTPYDGSMNCTKGAKGLILNITTLGGWGGSGAGGDAIAGQDISGAYAHVVCGGSGYKVGDSFPVMSCGFNFTTTGVTVPAAQQQDGTMGDGNGFYYPNARKCNGVIGVVTEVKRVSETKPEQGRN
mgnify:FL=1